MRVVLANLWFPPGTRDVDTLVAGLPLQRELARALVRRGHTVRVVQEFRYAARTVDQGVEWVTTVADPRPRRILAALGDPVPALRAPALHLLPPIRDFGPDVVHGFDLVAYPTVVLLPRPLVLTFHGGAPARRPAWRWLERRALADTTLLFASIEQGRGFPGRVLAVPELSTTMRRVPAPRLRGSPSCLSVGRLDAVKDPLTLLRGFGRLLVARPDAHLHLAWTEAPLFDTVRAFVDQHLAGKVTLLGRRPLAELPALYSGADLYLQASTREVYGRAPLEAIACGCAPVLSDIPAFRAMVPDPACLFPVGDADGLAAAALRATPVDSDWFERILSFDALAARVEAAYQ